METQDVCTLSEKTSNEVTSMMQEHFPESDVKGLTEIISNLRKADCLETMYGLDQQ